MSLISVAPRVINKISTIAGQIPTLGPSQDYTDGSWSVIDIYEGEIFMNIADKKVYTILDGDVIDFAGATILPGNTIVEGTYDELNILKSNNELIPGTYYKITDFQTIYDQPDYTSGGGGSLKGTLVTKTASIDPIILFAISNNEFHITVYRPSTPKHKIEFDFDFNQTEIMSAPAKGRISSLIDEFNNHTNYDHSVVLLKRYEKVSGSGIYNSYRDTGFGSVEVNTFGTNCNNNTMYYKVISGILISNNSFGNVCFGNTFGNQCYNNSFGNQCYNNSFGDSCQRNSFGSGCFGNSFGNRCSINSFGNDCDNNTFGDTCEFNSFGNTCRNNSFGNDGDNNYFGNQCYNNSFGNQCFNNSFGNTCDNNSFGNKCYNNSFGDGYQSNSFGNRCYSNSFGNTCRNNSFGNVCFSNIFGNICSINSFGNQCYNNSFGDGYQSNSFGNFCQGNTFGNDCRFNSFENGCYSNTFGDTCGYNSFEIFANNNIFGEDCESNSFGNDCSSNTFGNGCFGNSFGNDFRFNIIVDNCRFNDFKKSQSLNYTSATHIYTDYTCTISARQDGTYRLQYINNSDVTITVSATA